MVAAGSSRSGGRLPVAMRETGRCGFVTNRNRLQGGKVSAAGGQLGGGEADGQRLGGAMDNCGRGLCTPWETGIGEGERLNFGEDAG